MRCLHRGLGLLFVLSLSACGTRNELAQVVDSRWAQINASAMQHVVRRGETLYAIGYRYGKDYRQLAQLNHLTPPYVIKIGQVLQLRASEHAIFTRERQTPRVVQSQPLLAVTSYLNRPCRMWCWPTEGRVVRTFSPHQGQKGIDIAGQKGQSIRAVSRGVVAYAGSGLAGYGNLIIIKHNQHLMTAYGNNLRNMVREGQYVSAGQVIAEMGLIDRRYWGVHFEMRKEGEAVNPLQYLKKG